jgi:hypothetical protein
VDTAEESQQDWMNEKQMNFLRVQKKWQVTAIEDGEMYIYQFETDTQDPKNVVFSAWWVKNSKTTPRRILMDVETARCYWENAVDKRGGVITLKEQFND